MHMKTLVSIGAMACLPFKALHAEHTVTRESLDRQVQNSSNPVPKRSTGPSFPYSHQRKPLSGDADCKLYEPYVRYRHMGAVYCTGGHLEL
jgi:hypothetical protein